MDQDLYVYSSEIPIDDNVSFHSETSNFEAKLQNSLTQLGAIRSPVLDAAEAKTPERRLRDWLEGLNPNTSRAYARDLEGFAAYLQLESAGAALVGLCQKSRSVATTVLEGYRDKLIADGKSSSTINRRLSAINAGLAVLGRSDIGHGRLDVEPVPAEKRRIIVAPSVEDVARVVEALSCRRDPTSMRNLAIVVLAAQRGLRRGEIAGLHTDHVNRDRRTVAVRRKGKRELVEIALNDDIWEALASWMRVRAMLVNGRPGPVFIVTGNRSFGSPIDGNVVWQVILAASREIGQEWHPHALRHRAITEAYKGTGGSLLAAQVFAGHSSHTTTARYVNDKDELERQAVNAMAGIYARKDP